jgi:hypothetical protein
MTTSHTALLTFDFTVQFAPVAACADCTPTKAPTANPNVAMAATMRPIDFAFIERPPL